MPYGMTNRLHDQLVDSVIDYYLYIYIICSIIKGSYYELLVLCITKTELT